MSEIASGSQTSMLTIASTAFELRNELSFKRVKRNRHKALREAGDIGAVL